jgi:hypothetical protein
LERVKVLVRRISTGLYWNSKNGWVHAQEAEVFADSGKAILHCVEKEMRDVHVILDFDDPKYDVVLHPFGETGHELTSRELVEESRRLKVTSKEMSERAKALLAGALQSIAAMKEGKKKRPFSGKQPGGE